MRCGVVATLPDRRTAMPPRHVGFCAGFVEENELIDVSLAHPGYVRRMKQSQVKTDFHRSVALYGRRHLASQEERRGQAPTLHHQ